MIPLDDDAKIECNFSGTDLITTKTHNLVALLSATLYLTLLEFPPGWDLEDVLKYAAQHRSYE